MRVELFINYLLCTLSMATSVNDWGRLPGMILDSWRALRLEVSFRFKIWLAVFLPGGMLYHLSFSARIWIINFAGPFGHVSGTFLQAVGQIPGCEPIDDFTP